MCSNASRVASSLRAFAMIIISRNNCKIIECQLNVHYRPIRYFSSCRWRNRKSISNMKSISKQYEVYSKAWLKLCGSCCETQTITRDKRVQEMNPKVLKRFSNEICNLYIWQLIGMMKHFLHFTWKIGKLNTTFPKIDNTASTNDAIPNTTLLFNQIPSKINGNLFGCYFCSVFSYDTQTDGVGTALIPESFPIICWINCVESDFLANTQKTSESASQPIENAWDLIEMAIYTANLVEKSQNFVKKGKRLCRKSIILCEKGTTFGWHSS